MCPSNTYKKKIKKKKFDSKRKRTFIYLGFSSIATLKKKIMILHVNFVS